MCRRTVESFRGGSNRILALIQSSTHTAELDCSLFDEDDSISRKCNRQSTKLEFEYISMGISNFSLFVENPGKSFSMLTNRTDMQCNLLVQGTRGNSEKIAICFCRRMNQLRLKKKFRSCRRWYNNINKIEKISFVRCWFLIKNFNCSSQLLPLSNWVKSDEIDRKTLLLWTARVYQYWLILCCCIMLRFKI